ncbi:MAG: hypothetical protein FWD14_04760 [Treponema sp.]|nr:hypothetical protein [Treponema sp.]
MIRKTMIKQKKRLLLSALILAVCLPLIIFSFRSPVLIVVEESFIRLYGDERLKKDAFKTSLAIFRPIKTVNIANDAGDDIIPYAVMEVSSRPFCVIFPVRFSRSASMYREKNNKTSIVILTGRETQTEEPEAFNGFYVYRTDIDADFYRAGRAAAIFAGEKGNIAVFIDSNQNLLIGAQIRDSFLRGARQQNAAGQISFFTDFPDFPDDFDPSCVVLAGSGIDFLDRKAGIPVILFSWLNPSAAPLDIVLIIDDSPLTQVSPVAGMVFSGISEGQIRSKFTVLNPKEIDKEVLRKINKIE